MFPFQVIEIKKSEKEVEACLNVVRKRIAKDFNSESCTIHYHGNGGIQQDFRKVKIQASLRQIFALLAPGLRERKDDE